MKNVVPSFGSATAELPSWAIPKYDIRENTVLHIGLVVHEAVHAVALLHAPGTIHDRTQVTKAADAITVMYRKALVADGRSRSRSPADRHHSKRRSSRRSASVSSYESSDESSSSSESEDEKEQRHKSKKHKSKKHKKSRKHKHDSAERRSAITGKKIKLKIRKTSDDKERDQNRSNLLQFLNSAF
ncbi:uncharacterized protein BYT42DRAFT_616526 [Radiomyces spectabilis]|uniref:uncharacterized protein n=1 Tax=Radiomyces spectabilis TaxID=64574 RepID=UPI00221FDFD4|nr:uncharacterized protein BYT42DRAFT_616526 [Radiomyces spectabilis]KAI8371435.1 hypothetical protein BYT42DRAFT_616526 [Radiomyces spectabilis]